MRVGIVGGGNMGLAYARSLVGKNIVEPNELVIYESFPERVMFLKGLEIAELKPDLDDSIKQLDAIVLAVKPQSFSELSVELKPLISKKTVLISIMAGVRSEIISSKLGSDKVVRAMPNTPCQNGIGATGYYLFDSITTKESELVNKILASTGLCKKVETEEDIDAVTALSGSGPAYVFAFAKAMQSAGESMGLSPDNSEKLLLQTIKGALNLMETSGKSFDELIAAVKSKGGTTEAALNSLTDNSFEQTIVTALGKAKSRAKELSDEIK